MSDGLVRVTDTVRVAEIPLVGSTPVRVTLVRGEDFSILVDTGTHAMYSLVMKLIDSTCGNRDAVRLILNTHGHHDHIGSNHAIKQATGALLAAPAAAVPWIEDRGEHYRSFCLIEPDVLPDAPWMREECLGLLGPESHVDVCPIEDMRLRPGGSELQAIDVSGHAASEIGFIEQSTNTLILGDGLLCNTIVDIGPLFHGYVDARKYRRTLSTLRLLVCEHRFEHVVSAHLPLTDGAGFEAFIDRAQTFFGEVEEAILELSAHRPAGLREIWLGVCGRWGYRQEFRGLAMVRSHLELLAVEGSIGVADTNAVGETKYSSA